jgi:hypothetical protein
VGRDGFPVSVKVSTFELFDSRKSRHAWKLNPGKIFWESNADEMFWKLNWGLRIPLFSLIRCPNSELNRFNFLNRKNRLISN